jgi:hypothetical protein
VVAAGEGCGGCAGGTKYRGQVIPSLAKTTYSNKRYRNYPPHPHQHHHHHSGIRRPTLSHTALCMQLQPPPPPHHTHFEFM